MKRKLCEILIFVIFIMLIVLAVWVLAKMTGEDHKTMESMMGKYIENGCFQKEKQMNSGDLVGDAKFTTDGKDVWETKNWYNEPSCTLVNLKTLETKNFGMDGITAQEFHRITMPEIPKKSK